MKLASFPRITEKWRISGYVCSQKEAASLEKLLLSSLSIRDSRGFSEQLICARLCLSAARGTNDELLSQEIRFYLVAEGVGGKVHGGGEGFDAGWAPLEDGDKRFQIAPV